MINSIIIICIMLLLSAFFSGMEIAFLSKNRLREEIDRKQSPLFDFIAQIFERHSGQYITTILVGNNISLVIYSLYMSLLLRLVASILGWEGMANEGSVLLETIISTVIILFCGEFLPKSIFKNNPNFSLEQTDNTELIKCTADGIQFEGAVCKTLKYCRRFYPHLSSGEGQFFALLKNRSEYTPCKITKDKASSPSKEEERIAREERERKEAEERRKREEEEEKQRKLQSMMLDENEKNQLEQWTNKKCGEVIFDSDKDNWSKDTSVFNERIIGKKQLVFLIEDSEGEKFGYELSLRADVTSIFLHILRCWHEKNMGDMQVSVWQGELIEKAIAMIAESEFNWLSSYDAASTAACAAVFAYPPVIAAALPRVSSIEPDWSTTSTMSRGTDLETVDLTTRASAHALSLKSTSSLSV